MSRNIIYLGNLPHVAQTLKNIPGLLVAGWIIQRGDDTDGNLSKQAAKWDIPLAEAFDDTEIYQILFDWKLNVDLGVIGNFGIILKYKTLNVPKNGFVNLHFGLLPDYPGKNPILDAMRDKQEVVGVTLHRVTERIDDGPILQVKKVSCIRKSHLEIGQTLTRISCEILKENFEKGLL